MPSVKTYSNLFDTIVTLDNLSAAYRAARRGKRGKPQAALFEIEAERNLLRLHGELREGAYRPGRYRLLLIREPKRRVIAAAPFRDRVVHHAWCRVVMPLLFRSFIDDTYACLPGRGTHRAVLRHLEFMRKYEYRCHLDVRAFFPSVTVDLLLDLIAQRIQDRRAVDLLSRILESGLGIYREERVMSYLGLEPYGPEERRGLPIGNLTSQHLANCYLSELDHLIKREWKTRGYLRYMDDLVLFGDHPGQLRDRAEQAIDYLDRQRKLEVKQRPRVIPTRAPATYLGYVASRSGLRLSASMLTKIRCRARRLASTESPRLQRTLSSWKGVPW